MTVFLAMLVGLALPGQDAGSPAAPSTTPTEAEVVAPAVDGVVVLECRLNSDRRLRDCVIISETPSGQGFGEAALNAARRTLLSRRTVEQAESDAKVRFTTRFRLAD